MKTETKRILEKAQAGDAEAQYLTGLYYEDKGNADEAFQRIFPAVLLQMLSS